MGDAASCSERGARCWWSRRVSKGAGLACVHLSSWLSMLLVPPGPHGLLGMSSPWAFCLGRPCHHKACIDRGWSLAGAPPLICCHEWTSCACAFFTPCGRDCVAFTCDASASSCVQCSYNYCRHVRAAAPCVCGCTRLPHETAPRHIRPALGMGAVIPKMMVFFTFLRARVSQGARHIRDAPTTRKKRK